ncbi:unnamed protein product [Gadus morhua 'NCC']
MRMDDNLKEGLRHQQKYLIHPSTASEDSISADKELLAPKKKKKKKRKNKHQEQNDELHNASSDLSTASIQESVSNELQPVITTFRKEHRWVPRSERWREKLEKLSKSEDIIKVGSILFVNDEEYRVATGSDGTEVFLGLREDGTEVAVKRMSKTNENVLKNEESFLRLPELEHKNIVRYMDYAKDNNFGYLALQLCEFTLEELLKPDLTEKKKRNLVTDVLSSLSVLHGQTPQILHRDIKPQNVLLDVHRKARLADFGISRTLPKGQTSRHTKKAGTKCWMARENIDEDVDVPCKMSADIQVAGMLTYYILSGGHHPFGRGCRCESNILDGLYSLDHVQDLIAKDLVKWMINKNPIERPTVQQCLAHPFFWSTSRKIDYLKSIGNEEEVRNYKATDKRLLDELDRDVGEASWKDWKHKFPPELVQKMDGKGNPEDAEHIDLMATFPDLFGGVYVFAKNKAKGSDGTEVFLGLREDGTEVAVKRMSRSNYQVLKNEESFLRLPKLDHPFIVRYIDFAEDENFGYLALQLCERNLEEFLRDEVPDERKRKLVEEVLSSLSVLHGQTPQIIHRDIKPQNVLLDVCGKARLADFGISRRLPIGQTSLQTKGAGTKCWMARENIDEDVDVPCKMSADIQVAGMLTYYILSGGHHPFGKKIECEYNVYRGQYSLEHVRDVIAKNLIEWMINKNPKERPRVKQCLAHPFFWSRLRKVEYLKSIGNEEEVRNYKATDKRLLDELDRDVGEASWKDWKQKFPPELVQKMDGKGKYSENTAGLLRFIRNLLEHYPEDAEHIDLMATFPDLFGGVYVFAKNKGWNSRVSLRRMFQEEEEDVTSGGVMNTLSLEDRAQGFSVPVQESGGPPHSVTVIP